MADLHPAGLDLGPEHVGQHLALTLPGYARIDGVITEVRRHARGGAWVDARARPYGFDIPVTTFVGPEDTIRLYPEPVEEVLAGG